jgi:hypothetical protein
VYVVDMKFEAVITEMIDDCSGSGTSISSFTAFSSCKPSNILSVLRENIGWSNEILVFLLRGVK